MEDARKPIGTIARAAVLVYLAVLLILLTAPMLSQQPSLDGLAHTVLALLLLPAPLLLIAALLVRAWSQAALLAVAALGFAVVYGGVLLPRPAAEAQGQPFDVLTFNVQRAASSDEVESIAAIVLSADADVVALQELSATAADGLAAALADAYPYHALHGKEAGHLGQGIFSKYPIREDEYWRNPELEATLGHMWAVLDVDGRAVTVFSAHPVPPYSPSENFNARAHAAEIESVLSRAAERCGPVLMVGDWNMTDQFPAYEAITRSYTDAYRETSGVGFGFTYPNGQRYPVPPLVRIDHAFYNAAFAGLQARVIPQSGTSDHRPLHAQLVLLPEAEVDLGCEP